MLKELLLDEIEEIKNYRDVEPPSETDLDIVELTASIKKQYGVLQPILVRPHPFKKERYQLVFGHRRRLASRLAGFPTIPCMIKEIADEDILEVQVTENLQRKDVHPLDEAVAFRALMKDKAYSIEGIADRFSKKPEYVALRLKLNDLMPDLQTRFKKNILSLAHAQILCRLRTEDQKEVTKAFGAGHMGSAESLKDWINRNIVRQLSSAPFKRDDETLNPSAGPCTTCKKRSGCNQLLFADIKEDDRCFDKGCFQTKLDAFFLLQLRDIIENKPAIHLIQTDESKLSKEINTLIRQMNVTILDNKNFQRHGGYGKFKAQAKGFFLDGYSKGKIETIYVQGPAKKEEKDGKPAKRTLKDVEAEIATLKQRQERAIELDAEKVWKELSEVIQNIDNMPGIPLSRPFAQEELNALGAALLTALTSSDYEEHAAKVLGLSEFFYFDVEDAPRLIAITIQQIYHLLRLFMLHKLNEGLSFKTSPGPFMLMPVLRTSSYLKERVEEVESAHSQESVKRIQRSEKRMNALLEEKKELEEKKPKASAKSKKAAKSKSKSTIAKGISSLLNDEPDEESDDE